MFRPTIRDVARKAGVGIGTVSRVLNNSPKVTPETRQAVLAAIAELGFRPNTIARQLPRRTRLHNIGVVTQPFINYQAFAAQMRGLQLGLYDYDSKRYEIVLYSVRSLAHFDEQLTAIVRTGTVDGLIIIDFDLLDEQKQMLRDAGLPFVGLNHLQDPDWPCIGADNHLGGYLAASYLLDLGHTDIAYLGDELVDTFEFKTSGQRYEGFRRALVERGLPVKDEYVRLGFHDYDVAIELATELLRLPNPPTAIFAMCDMQALACLDAARRLGLRVPEAVSVMGFDDLETSYHVGLTTVRQHFEPAGRLAVQHLLALIDGAPPPPPVLPPPEVIPRQTTRPLAGKGAV